jgi:hypothetical protein
MTLIDQKRNLPDLLLVNAGGIYVEGTNAGSATTYSAEAI